jgi:predicted nucleic acid-binding Zn ribbon protein
LDSALGAVRREAAPATLLAGVQGCWEVAVGDVVAAEAKPVAERDGVVTVACGSAAWAQELDLLQEQILASLLAHLGDAEGAPAEHLRALRFTADAARHQS